MPEQATVQPETTSIVFKGRKLEVKIPSIEKLAKLRKLVKMLNRVQETGNLTPEQAITYTENCQDMIASLLPKKDDRDWLDYMFMVEDLPLPDAFDIITASTDAWRDQVGGSEKPVKKPAARRAKK